MQLFYVHRITVTSVRTSNHIFLPEYQVSASNMPKVAGTSRTTFLSLPRELRQKILLEVFSQAESSRLIDQVTSNSIKQQKSISKQTTDEFWAIQERGWIVQSYFSTTFREPRQRLEEEFDFEIASMLAVLEAVHGLVKEDMEYIHRQWRAILELSLNAWCMDFRLQHRQLKGAGPGSNNWWWIPTWEDDNWYHMLLDSQPNIESHVR